MNRSSALRTKIVATLGPASATSEVLDRMVLAGMTVARINFAHGDKAMWARNADLARRAARRAKRTLAVMGDLAGPKIRVGELRDDKVLLEKGRRIVLTSRALVGTAEAVQITEPTIFRDVKRGDPVFLADGSLELVVQEVRAHEMECRILVGGLLHPRKGVNLPRTKLRMPSLTSKDQRDLAWAVKEGFDALALSFVRRVEDLQQARRLIGRARTPLIAKIEKREATRNLPKILEAADGVMVARGDLGVETSYDEVPLLQKQIIRLANEAAKPVVTATQMLKSMVENPHPTRAEATDIANAILDGTDAVMLSEETAMGQYPAQSVETMAKIARRAEGALDSSVFQARAKDEQIVAMEVSEAAVQVARSIQAAAIITPTAMGATSRFVSRLRPSIPVIAMTRHLHTARFLNFTWGVEAVHTPELGPLEATLRYGMNYAKKNGIVRPGDRVVFTAGFPPFEASSNLMTVQTVH
jgi:pyruvate kinase